MGSPQAPPPRPRTWPRSPPLPGLRASLTQSGAPTPTLTRPCRARQPRPSQGKSTPGPSLPRLPPAPTPWTRRNAKAQNRTAAFGYREKMKSAMDNVEDEMEALEERNGVLRDQLTEMETEFKYLKKLMTEAGLGRYAAAVKY